MLWLLLILDKFITVRAQKVHYWGFGTLQYRYFNV